MPAKAATSPDPYGPAVLCGGSRTRSKSEFPPDHRFYREPVGSLLPDWTPPRGGVFVFRGGACVTWTRNRATSLDYTFLDAQPKRELAGCVLHCLVRSGLMEGSNMVSDHKKAWLRAVTFAGLAASALIFFTPQVRGQSNTAPQYTSAGELRTPAGFETWVFVGSNLGLGYKDELAVTTRQETAHADHQGFHNIY